MRIYLVERTDKVGWDEYESFVCAAKSTWSARKLQPDTYGWVTNPETLKVKLIGEANKGITEPLVLHASFKAG
jgi:hypothetical protein